MKGATLSIDCLQSIVAESGLATITAVIMTGAAISGSRTAL